ncbi:MAG: hypothetical protein LIP02_13635 [Bacteroidales bacterium]|nr:hypothetical protein [Bacteroidales bacterium]MCC8177370.1 hypothetical protein [Bacteroidales bacterium]
MLNSEQQKCIELMVSGNMTQREIAKEIDVAPETISRWKRTDEFIDTYNSAVRQNIQDAASDALRTMVSLLKARSELVRFNAAKDILDRAGFKPEDNINLTGSGTVVIIDDCDQ